VVITVWCVDCRCCEKDVRRVPARRRRRKWLVFVAILMLVPFPTQMVPAWEIRFMDKEGNALPGRVVQQRWKSYTYFAAGGFDQRCTDEQGSVRFPPRKLWSSIVGRIISPVIASALSLAHGSQGTDSNVQLFDRYYMSDNYHWRDNMSLYSHHPDPSPPSAGVAEPRKQLNDELPTCSQFR
jgi:hypothetical protein